MRVGLIGCSATKLDRSAPAAELYTGPIFTLARAWISERSELDAWGILSAQHGLVLPDQTLEPYDLDLAALPTIDRKAWAQRTREQVVARWGTGTIYMVLAGADYRAALDGLLVEDIIASWSRWRGDRGLRPRHVGIGVLKKYLCERKGFGA